MRVRSWGAAIICVPAALVVALLLVGGVSVTLAEALMSGSAPGASLESFRAAVTGTGFARSLLLTVWVSFASTVLTLALAVATALTLRRMRRFQRLVTYVYQLPLTLPHMVVAAAALMLLGQSGLLARVAYAIGFISGPSGFPELVYDRWGAGIILAYAWKQVPFVGLFALAVLQSVGHEYESVARSLGARPLQAVWHVLIPLILPALVPSAIIIFAFVFGSFEVPLLLGARYPSMLSVLAYRLYTDADLSLRPRAMALSFIVSALVFLLLGLYQALQRATRSAR